MGVAPGTRATRAGETQSAKVSICHEVVETETEWRPWTSHVIREETLQKLRRARPKSAATPAQVIGPPKRAWTASSERKADSARSGAQSRSLSGAALREAAGEEQEEERDQLASRREEAPKCVKKSSSCTADPQSSSLSSVILSPAFIFPQYPTYPDIRVGRGEGGTSARSTGSSSLSHSQASQQGPGSPPSLPPNDPAVPLIRAIKEEMKRFEKDPPPNDKPN